MLSNSFCFWFKRKEKRKELLVTPVFILGVFLMCGPARTFILEDYIYNKNLGIRAVCNGARRAGKSRTSLCRSLQG